MGCGGSGWHGQMMADTWRCEGCPDCKPETGAWWDPGYVQLRETDALMTDAKRRQIAKRNMDAMFAFMTAPFAAFARGR